MLSSPPKPFQRNHKIRDAISKAIYDEMANDPAIHLFGEGCEVKTHYDAPKILQDFSGRVHTLPISEDGNTNFAVGASLLGCKTVVDVITADFLYRTMDSICNTAAKLNYLRNPNQPPSTIVIRSEFLTGGPTTGQRPEALFTHIPGLSVILPSNPRDAYGLMRTALTTTGVTLFFEDRHLADDEYIHPEDQEDGEAIPFGKAAWRYKGVRGGVTIVSYGIMSQKVEGILNCHPFNGDYYSEDNLRADLIDLRSLYPIDWSGISKLLERSGQLLIIEPDITYGGVGAEIAAHFAEDMPNIRVKRLGAPKLTIPAAPSMHHTILPSEEDIIAAVRSMTQFLFREDSNHASPETHCNLGKGHESLEDSLDS